MKYHMHRLTLIILFFLSTTGIFAQKSASPIKPQLFGLHLTLVDYNSPTLIRKTSLREVLSKGDIFNPSKLSPALSISYWNGLVKNIDFSGKLNVISYDYSVHNDPLGVQNQNEFGAELEGALNFHLI